MKLGPLTIQRSRPVAAAEPVTRAPKELGATGTINLQGYLQTEEYKRELVGEQGIRVYDMMRKGDAAVREALWHIFAPILNAGWDVESCSDEPEDLEVAAAVRCAYFDPHWLRQPFKRHLHQMLLHLAWGHAVFETVWHVIDDTVQYENPETGEPVEGESRQWLTWRKFAQRLPRTILKWNEDEAGELESVTQQAFKGDTFVEVDIPIDRLLVLVNEQEGGDYNGLSLLRSAYKSWWLKENAEKVQAVAIERYGVGTPICYPPSAASDDSAQFQRAEDILMNLRSGEQSYIVAPGPKAQASEKAFDGWLFEILSPAGDLPDFTRWLEYLRGDIKGNVLARFSELGHGSVGARATGDSQSPVWTDALHAVASYLCDVHNADAIPRWVRANYPDVKRYPKLVVHDIESKNLEEFANAHSKLVLSNAIIPDRTYRQFVRDSMGAPDEDEDAEEQVQPKPLPGDDDDPGFDGPPALKPDDEPELKPEEEELPDAA